MGKRSRSKGYQAIRWSRVDDPNSWSAPGHFIRLPRGWAKAFVRLLRWWQRVRS